MSPGPRWPAAVASLATVAWIGAVLWRYQAIASPQPLVSLLLPAVGVALFTLATLGVGYPVWRWAGGGGPLSGGSLVVVLASGAGVLMAAAAAASLVGALRPWCVIALATLALAAGCHRLVRLRRELRVAVPRQLLAPAALLVAAVLVTLPTTASLSPFYDQFNYHLAFPYQWLRAGGVFVFPRHAYSYLPSNMGLLYTYALATVGAWGGQVIHWWMAAVATLGAGALAARLAGPRAGAWSAAIFAATPAVLIPATWAGADLGVAALAVAAWLAVLPHGRWAGARPDRWWLLAGALAGLAAGCKYLALAMVAVPIFVVTASLRRGAPPARHRRRVGLWLAGAALAFAPWMLRNLLVSGNPLFPFFNRLLPPTVVIEQQGAAAAAEAARVAAFPASRLAPRDRLTLGTFNPQGAAGAIGPLYLALAPLALWSAVRDRRRGAHALLAGAVLGVLGWWWAPQLGRYLAPVLALLAALLGAGWARLQRRQPPRLRGWLAALPAAVLLWNTAGVLGDGLDRLACLVGRAREEVLLAANVSYWPAIAFVNETLPADAKLLLVAESRTLFLDRDVVVEDPFRTPLLVELADAEQSAPAMLERLGGLGVTHLLYNDAEAGRIAEMTRRQAYFLPASAEGKRSLDAFLATCVDVVFRQDRVTVMRLRSRPRE